MKLNDDLGCIKMICSGGKGGDIDEMRLVSIGNCWR